MASMFLKELFEQIQPYGVLEVEYVNQFRKHVADCGHDEYKKTFEGPNKLTPYGMFSFLHFVFFDFFERHHFAVCLVIQESLPRVIGGYIVPADIANFSQEICSFQVWLDTTR